MRLVAGKVDAAIAGTHLVRLLSSCSVAHEYSHGVTTYTSGLVYEHESGALHEGYSDAIAATADRSILNKDRASVWSIGEDVDVYGFGFRNMADPTEMGDPDHFADRFTGSYDHGGAHTNAGISNKAFYLMVQGGKHPKSRIVVQPLNADFDESITQAATIYFKANTQCLTQASDYLAMRGCTLLHSNTTQKPTVQAAWDAVGVKAILPLTPGVLLRRLLLSFNNDAQIFQLNRNLAKGESVTCWLNSSTGDPNLSVKYGRSPSLFPNSNLNDCASQSTRRVEQCNTPTATYANTKVFVAVESRGSASNINLLCKIQAACKPLNSRCTTSSRCCSRTCDGPTPASRVCKTCKGVNSACARSTQCCSGLTCRKRKCKG
jgi:bacillolysin